MKAQCLPWGAHSQLWNTKYILSKMGPDESVVETRRSLCFSEPLQWWLRTREGLPGERMPRPALAGHVGLSLGKEAWEEGPSRVHRPMARAKALRFKRAWLWGKAVIRCDWNSRVCGRWGRAEAGSESSSIMTTVCPRSGCPRSRL